MTPRTNLWTGPSRAPAADEAASPSDQHATRAGLVEVELRRLVSSGELAPGTPLRQVAIAKRFGVSTTPVREAFTTLAREGLVTHDAHRGVIVFVPSIADVRENYEIRTVLEPLAARFAAVHATDVQLDALAQLVEEMRGAVLADPTHYARVLNPTFHARVYECAGRPRLSELIEALRGNAIAYLARFATRDLPQHHHERVEAEHDEIVAAIRARAPGRASHAVRVHLERNLAQILEAMRDAEPEVGGT